MTSLQSMEDWRFSIDKNPLADIQISASGFCIRLAEAVHSVCLLLLDTLRFALFIAWSM